MGKQKTILKNIWQRWSNKIRHLWSQIKKPSPATLAGVTVGATAGRMVAYAIAFFFSVYFGLYYFAFIMAFGVVFECWFIHNLSQHFISYFNLQLFVKKFI